VRTELVGQVGYVWLDRPDARNAINVPLAVGLDEALRQTASTARVIVIRGTGGHFSVGGDLDEVSRLRAVGAEGLRPLFESFGGACALIAKLSVPVMAAVEGYAMAGGFELMQACDLAVVNENAVLADNHSNLGQVPGGGGSQRLPRLVGRQRALAHILTGDRLSADEAVAWGLAYRSLAPADFDGAVTELAQQLAAKDPTALARSKRLVREGVELSLADGLAFELETIIEHLVGGVTDDNVAAFDVNNL
jgi:enoyl-CoA hydratase/carnithine racemase